MMTRDAKIGLLVGLAFILIVGILLSEHITTATTPDQASLAIAGDRARQATHAPIAPVAALPKTVIDADPQPRTAVATRDLLDAPPSLPPTTRIELGQPIAGQIQVIRVDAPSNPNLPPDPIADAIGVSTATPQPMLGAGTTGSVGTTLINNGPVTTVTPAPAGNDPRVPTDLAEVAKQAGVELVSADGQLIPAATANPQMTNAAIPNGARVREYKAQTGDSLGKIAARFFGRSTPATCDAIVALNPSLKKDRSRILVGATYLIPADAWAAVLQTAETSTAAGNTPDSIPSEVRTAVTETQKAIQAESTTTLYTVKAGDSLWRIAEREVGASNAVAQIKRLNPDAFANGNDTVKIGMQLKLPAKTKDA